MPSILMRAASFPLVTQLLASPRFRTCNPSVRSRVDGVREGDDKDEA